MPTIPVYDNFKTEPNIPQGRVEPLNAQGLALPGQMEEKAGSELQKTGEQTQLTGAHLMEFAVRAQDEANALRVDDALNQAKEASLKLQFDPQQGFNNVLGQQALNRPNGQSLSDEYTQKLQAQVQAIGNGLGNDAQRNLFARHANNLVAQFQGQAMQHEGQQYQTYNLSVRDGTIKTGMDSIALNWNNPEEVNQAVTSIQSSAYDQARLLGKSAVWAEAAAKQMTSQAHMQAIGAAIQNNNLSYADLYLKAHSKEMNADDILKVNGILGQQQAAHVALGVSNAVMQHFAPQLSGGNDLDRAFNILIKTESGGKQSVNGQPVTSPKGAIGIAQVMPGTGPEAAKLAGLPWDENRYRNDAQYNAAIGKAYFAKQLQDNGGDLAKAYAAYNAGPGALQKAVKADQQNWLAHLPQETQAYVTKNMQAFQSGAGAVQKPTLLDIHNAVRADPAVANDPQRLKLALDETQRQYHEYDLAQKQTQEQATADAYNWLAANNGQYAAMPAALRSRVPGKEQDNLLAFSSRIAQGVPVQTNWDLYAQLYGNRESLMKTNLQAYQNELAPTEFKQLVERQDKLKNSPETEATYLQSQDQYINTQLNQAGIDTTPKDGDSKAWSRLGRARGMLQADISTAEHDKGKPLSRDEINKVVAQSITNMVQKAHVRDNWLYMDKDVPLVDLTDEQKAKAVLLPAQREAIVAKIKASGRPVTEAYIQRIFQMMINK